MRISTKFACVLALVLGVAPASAAAAKPQTCATLTGKHLKTGGSATVVTQLINRESERSGIERVAYVCASPRGRAWRVGSAWAPYEPPTPRITVVTGAGTWVVLRFESVIGEGFSESESAANGLTGKHFQFWTASGGMGEYSGLPLEVVKLDTQGRLALILGVEGTPKNEGEQAPIVTRKVVGVTSSGQRKVLDTASGASIPTASLQLVGGVVHWTDGGVARTAQP